MAWLVPSGRLDDVADAVDVGKGEIGVHGQRQHLGGHPPGHRGAVAGVDAPVAGVVADERVEVLAGAHACGVKGVKDVVARGPEGLGVEDHGQVGVVGPHTRGGAEHPYTRDGLEAVPVALGHDAALGDLLVEVAQVANAHRGTELVHLGVSADVLHVLRPGDSEVLPLVERVVERGVPEADGAALDGVEDLRGVEAEHGGVAEGGSGYPVSLDAEGVGGVVDDPEAVAVGDVLDGVDVAEVAVDVDWHDGARAGRDRLLYALGVEGAVRLADVGEDGREALARDGVGRAREAEGGGNDLAAQVEGLEYALEGVVPVGEQAHVRRPQALLEGHLELLVLLPHVGEPVALPQRTNLLAILFERWH